MARINRLWHATAMAASYDGLLGPMQKLFGATVMHDTQSEEPAVGRRGGMIWIGDNSIEIGAPLGPVSPVRNFVEKWGGGMHSLALGIEDAPTALKQLEGVGVRPVAHVSEHIFFTHPGDTDGLMLEFSATYTHDDPRWGYPLKPLPQPALTPALKYSFVAAVVTDPQHTAERMAEVFDTAVLRSNPNAAPNEIGAIVSMVDTCLVLYPMPTSAEQSTELWGQIITRNRFYGHGLTVEDLPGSLAKLEGAGVKAFRDAGDGQMLLDPAVTGVPTFLSGNLLPEDPR
ncbi:MAG: hypothetical protein AB7L13_00695 [Acidimicrobiia bacterium]